MNRLACVLALSVAGCAGLAGDGTPRAVATSRLGEVTAPDEPTARRVAAELDDVESAVRAMVPGLRSLPVDVWVGPRDSAPSGQYLPGNDAIVVQGERGPLIVLVDGEPDSERLRLAHELVHALAGEEWQALGGPLGEGLPEYVGLQLGGEAGASSRCSRLVNAAQPEGGLRLSVEYVAGEPRQLDWLPKELPPSRAPLIVGPRYDLWRTSESNIGRAALLVEGLVERLGWEGLHRLCLAENGRSKLASTWCDDAGLQALAGFRASGAEWRAWIESRFGEPELRFAAKVEAPRFAPLVATEARSALGPVSADEFLARAQVRLRVRGGASVALAEVPEAAAALRAAWEASAR